MRQWSGSLPLLDLLRVMALAREGDRREGILLRQGKGSFQLPGAGHEALAALAYCLLPQDYLYPHYRDRALLLARGMSNYEMALSYFARSGSSSGGRQLASHHSDRSRHIVSLASPTGLQAIPAAGTAWSCKKNDNRSVTLCCIGDASLRQGDFYESWCLALEHDLPLVFVVEDNGYGISTPTAKMNPWNIGALSQDRVIRADGRRGAEVFEAGRAAIEGARLGRGPAVLWFEMDRLSSHTSSDDQRIYRPAVELEAMLSRDPIPLLIDHLVSTGRLDPEMWMEEQQEIARSVDADYHRAEAAPNPDPASTMAHVFSSHPAPACISGLPVRDTWTMVDAVNETLRGALAEDDRVILFGEDLEDPKGGVFGLTRGLSTQFPGRVLNSPLAESTIAGAAAGLALAGQKPIFELQFIDFVGPAFNQIVNQIATLRWRSVGSWKCPLVILAPCGAYLPSGGPWHSQTNEAWFAHAPGLQIVMPSTPHDAAALLKAALAGDDPVLFLLPKHLFRRRSSIRTEAPCSLGQAVTRQTGKDVTVLAWGNCVHIALDAADSLDSNGCCVEVIDLRSIVPCDWQAIEHSLAKTGRLVVVQEDNRTCSFGQAILAEMTSRTGCWDLLAAPPQLVCRPDVHVPFDAMLEEHVLPNRERVCEAIRLVMGY